MLELTAPLASLAGGSPVAADITEGLPSVSTSTDPVYSAPIDLPAGEYAFEVSVTNTGSSRISEFFTIRLADPAGNEVMGYIVPAHDTWPPAQAVVFHTTITAPGAYRISMQTSTTSTSWGVGHIDRIRVIRIQPMQLRVGSQIGEAAYGPLRDWALSIGKTYETITEITVPMRVIGPSLQELFADCSSLTSIPALDTSQVTDTGYMFYGCWALESVTLPGMGNGFTTKQTLDMRETKLNAAAANALMQSLGTPPPGGNLQLPDTATGADTSIAASKNWEVTIG